MGKKPKDKRGAAGYGPLDLDLGWAVAVALAAVLAIGIVLDRSI